MRRHVLSRFIILLMASPSAVLATGCSDDKGTPADARSPDAPAPDARGAPDAVASDATFPDSPPGDLPNVPEIIEVMVHIDPRIADWFVDPLSSFSLIFGLPFGFDLCPSEGPCPSTHDGAPTVCQQAGPATGHCVVAATGELPAVTHADPAAATIRFVVGELLDGTTVEHFACACQGDNLLDLHPENCVGSPWSDDFQCASCTGDEMTAGKCVDTDFNGLPDIASFKPGLATLTCTAPSCPDPWTAGTSGHCTYLTREGDGVFSPSGNQFLSSVDGLKGMGPAIVVAPATPLPTSSDCTIVLSSAVKTQDGVSLRSLDSPPQFHTETFRLALTQPHEGAVVPVDTLDALEITGNVPLDPGSVTAADVTLTDTNGTSTVVATDVTVSGSTIQATIPSQALVAGHIYRVGVAGRVSDTFGTSLGAAFSGHFSAGSP